MLLCLHAAWAEGSSQRGRCCVMFRFYSSSHRRFLMNVGADGSSVSGTALEQRPSGGLNWPVLALIKKLHFGSDGHGGRCTLPSELWTNTTEKQGTNYH